MKVIVTVKLRKNQNYFNEERATDTSIPKPKASGICPLAGLGITSDDDVCSDIHGDHHSFLVEIPDSFGLVDKVKKWAEQQDLHVTRIEALESEPVTIG